MNDISVLITHVINDAVIEGFIPAISTQSTDPNTQLIIVTDHKDAHMDALIENQWAIQVKIFECDVFNPLAIIDILNNQQLSPTLVFSNSDHLQASTALVASFFKLPCKDWRQCITFKDKYLTRERLKSVNLFQPQYQLRHSKSLENELTTVNFPVVAKPKHGVASMNVQLCLKNDELRDYSKKFWQQSANMPILIESFVEGRLITLETLGDGETLVAVGGFEVSLTKPPHFIELGAVWNTPLCQQYRDACLMILREIGVGLGVCHSEFIITPKGEIHLVEINYRSIGDGREFLLDKMAHYPWFSTIIRLHKGTTIAELEAEYGQLHIDTHAQIHYVTADQSGTISAAPASFIKQMPQGVIIHQPLKQPNQSIILTHSNKDYLSRLLVYSDCVKNVEQLLQDALEDLHWQVE